MFNSQQYGRILGGDGFSSTYIPTPVMELTFWGQASSPAQTSWVTVMPTELTPWYVGPIPAPAPPPPGVTYHILLEDGTSVLLTESLSSLTQE